MRSGVAIFLALATLLGGVARADELNLFEWSAVAPVVITGEALGRDGRYLEIQVQDVLRGDSPHTGDVIRVNLRRTNRLRNRNVDPLPFNPDPEVAYLWLLQDDPSDPRIDPPVYRLVRGVRGARELPAEGADAVVAAMRRFVEIQSLNSDTLTWAAFDEMLEDTSPILLSTALEQHLKFRRGGLELLLSLRPLLDHPLPGIRQSSAALIAQILARHHGQPVPEEGALLNELVAKARRDGSIVVRMAATEAIDKLGDEAIEGILEEIARDDPEQLVRYTAERLLLQRRESDTGGTDSR